MGDDSVYKYADFGFIGFDLWQFRGGTIFDSIIVTDDVAEADAFAKKWKALSEVEKAAKKAEDDAKKSETASDDKDDDEDDEDEDGEETKESEERAVDRGERQSCSIAPAGFCCSSK